MGEHKIDRRDVEGAFERYRDLTGDDDARIVREEAGTVVFYGMTGRLSFRLIGAAAAFTAIDSYCQGYEAGRARSEP